MLVDEIHNLFLQCKSVSIDTRKIEKDSFFVCLKGERFDANIFAKEALERGAKYVLIDNPSYYIDTRTILVKDCLVLLQKLANYHRNYLKTPIISLTGSNGKTTTKELINAVLKKKFITKATIGNLNNHIGVPLTLLSFTKETEIGIVEMGANHQKEIEFLCEIAQPDYGYITNFGKAHLEGFGGVEGVIKGKSEMYEYLMKNNKFVFVNLDDELQVSKTNSINRFCFSLIRNDADVKFSNLTANPFVRFEFNSIIIDSNLIGKYNAPNVFVAIAIGKYFSINDVEIQEAIEKYVPDNNRSQIIERNTNKIILDAYNANPSSMKVAIENFIQLEDANKVAILGDMFELGEESIIEHRNLVNLLKQANIVTYFIGKDFYQNKIENDNLFFYNTFDDFSNVFSKDRIKNTTFLIKGSRGMALEKVLEII